LYIFNQGRFYMFMYAFYCAFRLHVQWITSGRYGGNHFVDLAFGMFSRFYFNNNVVLLLDK